MFIFILVVSLLSPAADKCRDIFKLADIREDTIPIHYLYAGQDNVGKYYGFKKGLSEAGLPNELNKSDLTTDQKKAFFVSGKDELKDELPMVRDPRGYVFILDGHHHTDNVADFGPEGLLAKAGVDLIDDFYGSNTTLEEFIEIAKEEGWFHSNSVEDLIRNPRHVYQLPDNPARSQIGLLFMRMTRKKDVPFKGKHFEPFVQFHLIDLINEKKLFTFSDDYSKKAIKELQQAVFGSPELVDYLVEQLRDSAPNSLVKYLEKLQENLSDEKAEAEEAEDASENLSEPEPIFETTAD